MISKLYKYLFVYSGIFIGVGIGFIYLHYLWIANLNRFVSVSASLVVLASVFFGLSFRMANTIKNSKEQELATYAAERFFYATVCWGVAGMAGYFAFSFEEIYIVKHVPDTLKSVKSCLIVLAWIWRSFAFLFAIHALYSMAQGYYDMMELLEKHS